MKTFGYGLQAFAGGFQTGLGLGMERKKIKMIQDEQKRAEKLAKEKEENAMNWYNTNKDSLTNFHTQSQETRSMLIFESVQYKKEWTDYLRDVEDFIQSGDLEGLKHLNDMEEERIKAERDALGIGIRPESGFIGKYYNEEDMNYAKKLQMGKLANKPIGTQMYEKEFGKLPDVAPKLTDTQVKLAEIDKLAFLTEERRNKMKVQLLVKDSAIAEKVKAIKAAGGTDGDVVKALGGGVIGPEPTTTLAPTPTAVENVREDILNADTLEDAKRIYKNHVAKYGETTDIPDVDKYWAGGKKSELDNLVAVLDEITAGTPESRNVKGNKKFTFDMDGKEVTKTGAEWYNAVYESYIALIKLLEKFGIDISQYKQLKSLSEIKKIKFGGFVGKGVETGDLISIYY